MKISLMKKWISQNNFVKSIKEDLRVNQQMQLKKNQDNFYQSAVNNTNKRKKE